MSQSEKTSSEPGKTKPSREERLAEALRKNLRKRKKKKSGGKATSSS